MVPSPSWYQPNPIPAHMGLSITGLPGHPVENVTLENIRLRFVGGGNLPDVVREIPEQPEQYPETSMFGILPAYAFYVRHAKNVRFRNVDLGFEKDDLRPALALDDVEDLDVFGLHARSTPSSHSGIWLKQVRGALIHGCRPHDPSKIFVQVNGDCSTNITITNNDLTNVEEAVALGPAVSPNAAYVANNRTQ